LAIRNETEFSISDLEIEHSFAYPGYIVFEKNGDVFHEISKGSVFSIKELKPGKKIEATFFSKAGYDANARNINITESGRILRLKPVIEAPDESIVFSEEFSSIAGFALRYPFTAYLVTMFCLLSAALFLLVLVLATIKFVFPEWVRKFSAQTMSEKDYNWWTSVLAAYEEKQKEDR